MRTVPRRPGGWTRFCALGDSFTEGLCDDLGSDGRYRGWADRVALELERAMPGLLYANLAIRGRLVRQVVEEQVPRAIDLAPDLTTLAVGVNDALRRSFDLDATATLLERATATLRRAGSDVVLFEFGDPTRRSRVMGTMGRRLAAYNSAVREIARAYDCHTVSFWGVAAFDDDRLWADDRLHLSPAGHALAARAVLDTLGLGDESWRTPAHLPDPPALPSRMAGHARWAGEYLVPWLSRRVQGRSSGDDVVPKRPMMTPC